MHKAELKLNFFPVLPTSSMSIKLKCIILFYVYVVFFKKRLLTVQFNPCVLGLWRHSSPEQKNLNLEVVTQILANINEK